MQLLKNATATLISDHTTKISILFYCLTVTEVLISEKKESPHFYVQTDYKETSIGAI